MYLLNTNLSLTHVSQHIVCIVSLFPTTFIFHCKTPLYIAPSLPNFPYNPDFDYLYLTHIVKLRLLSFSLSCTFLIMLVLFFFSCRLLIKIWNLLFTEFFVLVFVIVGCCLFGAFVSFCLRFFVWLILVVVFCLFGVFVCSFVCFFLYSILAVFCLCTVSQFASLIPQYLSLHS